MGVGAAAESSSEGFARNVRRLPKALGWNVSASEPRSPSGILGKLQVSLQWFTAGKHQKVSRTLPGSPPTHPALPKKLTGEASHFHPWGLADLTSSDN